MTPLPPIFLMGGFFIIYLNFSFILLNFVFSHATAVFYQAYNLTKTKNF